MIEPNTSDLLKNSKQQEVQNSFWNMVVHDLKGPIQAEIAAMRMLLADTKNFSAEQLEIINDVLSSMKYTQTLVFNVLQKYKEENGNLVIKKELHSFKTLLEECCHEVKYIAKERNLEVKFFYNSSFDEVMFDLDEIKRVINNLLTNTLKYSYKNTEIVINVENDDNNLLFSIVNCGNGVALENQDDIFEKFVSYSEKHKSINTGLGLYISKQIIVAHGGEIHFHSIPEKTTTITFRLPIK